METWKIALIIILIIIFFVPALILIQMTFSYGPRMLYDMIAGIFVPTRRDRGIEQFR